MRKAIFILSTFLLLGCTNTTNNVTPKEDAKSYDDFQLSWEDARFTKKNCPMEMCTIASLEDAKIWPVETTLTEISVRIYSISKEDLQTIPPTGALAAMEGFVDHSKFSSLELLNEKTVKVENGTIELPFGKEGTYYIELEGKGNFYGTSSEGYHYFVDINSTL